jgi:hypothetical protein
VESPAAAALSPADQETADQGAADQGAAATPAEPVAADRVADVAVPGGRICVEARTPAGGTGRDAGGERAPPRI